MAILQVAYLDTSLQKPQSNGEILPDLMIELTVDIKCEGCVSAVRNKLETLDGVKRVDVDLPNQVVRVLGLTSLKTMTTTLKQIGQKARLIGQGSPEAFLVSTTITEFKGTMILEVTQFAQVNIELQGSRLTLVDCHPGSIGGP
eukprot:Gb_08127 [translate_table: standard]